MMKRIYFLGGVGLTLCSLTSCGCGGCHSCAGLPAVWLLVVIVLVVFLFFFRGGGRRGSGNRGRRRR